MRFKNLLGGGFKGREFSIDRFKNIESYFYLCPVNNLMVYLEKQTPILQGEFLPFGNIWIRIFGGL